MAYAVLRVVANPYFGGSRALDHKGRAACHVTRIEDHRRMVGASTDHEASTADGRHVLAHDHGKVVEIHCANSAEYAHYQRLLAQGEFLPADLKTAQKTSSLAKKPQLKDGKPTFDKQGRPIFEGYFREPAEILAEAKAFAIKQFTDEHGFEPEIAKPPPPPVKAEPESTTPGTTTEPSAAKTTPPTTTPAATTAPTPAAPASAGAKGTA